MVAGALPGPSKGPPVAAAPAGQLNPSELSFDTLCKLMGTLRANRNHNLKKKRLERFMEINIRKESRDAFSVFRLLLPGLDNMRGNYHLLESKLATVLIKAASMDRKSKEAEAVKDWRKPGASRNAGNFAEVLQQHIFDQCCYLDPAKEEARRLKVGQLNEELDKLVAAGGNTEEQAAIFRRLMAITTPEQMAWIVQIILKNLKINCAEGTFLKIWHPDAEEYYNNSGMDLRYIFNDMIKPTERFSASLKPGKSVRPQMARATNNVLWAAEYMARAHGGRFLVENKFDGERMQVHRWMADTESGAKQDTIGYFSRMAIEHGERSSYSVMDDVIRQATRGPCILDGELIVWHKKKGVFAPFGSLKPLIGAIKEKKKANDMVEFNSIDEERAAVKDDDYEDMLVGECELVYVVFDIVHKGDSALNMEPLSKRLEVLEELVTPVGPVPLADSCVCGRVEVLLPGKTRFAGRLCSREASTSQEIQDAMEQAHSLHEEGIMVKALDSHWSPNDRSDRWLKLKPDYLAKMELDAVIIGAWGGKGGRGNLYTQYLLALADNERGGPSGVISKWVSFCRVGSGLDNEERQELHDRIAPLCVEASRHPAPDCYTITEREKPDVWITDPNRSMVLQVQADLRAIRTTIFATGVSVRFPRIQKVRGDKPAQACSGVRDLRDMLDREKFKADAEGERQLQQLRNPANEKGGKLKRKSSKRDEEKQRAKKKARVVTIKHAQLADVSQVEVESDVLKGCIIYFANFDGYNKGEVQEIVKRLGGSTSMMYVPRVTHILAGGEGKEVEKHRQQDRNVFHIAWLLACAAAKRRVSLKPRYFVHMSRTSIASNPEMDSLGDSYLSDVDASDVHTLLHRPLRPGQLSADDLAASLLAQSDAEGTDDEWQAHMPARLRQRLSGGGASAAATTVAAYLDAQLASIGALDRRFCALRGAVVTLLRLGAGAAGEGGAGAATSRVKQEGAGAGSGNSDEHNGSALAADQLFPAVRALLQQGRRSLCCLQRVQEAGAAAEVRLMGGTVSTALTSQVTHVVGLALPSASGLAASAGSAGLASAAAAAAGGGEGGDGGVSGEERAQQAQQAVAQQAQQAGVHPEAVLRAVAEQTGGGGGAVATFRLGLTARSMRLVAEGWVNQCLRQAESGEQGLPPEDDFPLLPTDTDSLQQWPWHLFPAQPAPAHSPGKLPASLAAAQGTSARARAGRRRGAATTAVQHQKRSPRARPPAQGGVKHEPKSELKQEEEGEEGDEKGGGQQGAAGPRRRGGFGRRGGSAVTQATAKRKTAAAAPAAAPAVKQEEQEERGEPFGMAAAAGGVAGMPRGQQQQQQQQPEQPEQQLQQQQQQVEAAAAEGMHTADVPPAAVPAAVSFSLFDALFGGSAAAAAAAAPAALPAAPAAAASVDTAQPPFQAPFPSDLLFTGALPDGALPDGGAGAGAAAAPFQQQQQDAAAEADFPSQQQHQQQQGGEQPARPKMSLRERMKRIAAGKEGGAPG